MGIVQEQGFVYCISGGLGKFTRKPRGYNAAPVLHVARATVNNHLHYCAFTKFDLGANVFKCRIFTPKKIWYLWLLGKIGRAGNTIYPTFPRGNHQLEQQGAVHTKWIKDLNVRAKMIKILGKNISNNLCDFGSGNGFSDITPKAQAHTHKKRRNRI